MNKNGKSNNFKTADKPNPSLKKSMRKARYIGYKERLLKKIIGTLFFIALAIIAFQISINTKTIVALSYSEQSNIDYLVYLKENNYYESPYLKKDMHYIASLIDHVNVEFNYNFQVNEDVDYTYKYYIEADVKVFEKSNESNIIFQKQTKLIGDVIKEDPLSKEFTISENLKINYNEYNDLVREFKSLYNITADSNLTLTLYIEVNGKYDKFEVPIKTKNAMHLTIPLSEQMLNIKMDYQEINNSDEFKEVSNKELINYIFLIAGAITTIIALTMLLNLLLFIGRSKNKKSLYEKKIESILREYDRVIIEVKKVLDIPVGQNIIEVKSFEELLDVSDKLGRPILYMQIHKNQKSWFIVKTEVDFYRYILKAVDLEK